MIYLDYAATTPQKAYLPPAKVVWGNSSSSHDLGHQAAEIEEAARKKIADAFGAKPNQIIFTSGGTEANNLAILGFHFKALKDMVDTHIVYSPIAHHSIIEVCDTVSLLGGSTEELDVYSDGCILPEDVDALLEEVESIKKVKRGLVVIDWVNNEIGVIQNVEKIIYYCHQRGWFVMLDAVQAAPHLPINFEELGADFMTISPHKFYGPKGVGALIAKDASWLSPVIIGGTQERGMRGGTKNAYLIHQFGESVENIFDETQAARLFALKEKLIEYLKERGITKFNSPEYNTVPNIINIDTGVDSATLVALLSDKGVYVSTGAACGGAFADSHVIKAINKNPSTALRVSFGRETNALDLKTFALLLSQEINFLKGQTA